MEGARLIAMTAPSGGNTHWVEPQQNSGHEEEEDITNHGCHETGCHGGTATEANSGKRAAGQCNRTGDDDRQEAFNREEKAHRRCCWNDWEEDRTRKSGEARSDGKGHGVHPR